MCSNLLPNAVTLPAPPIKGSQSISNFGERSESLRKRRGRLRGKDLAHGPHIHLPLCTLSDTGRSHAQSCKKNPNKPQHPAHAPDLFARNEGSPTSPQPRFSCQPQIPLLFRLPAARLQRAGKPQLPGRTGCAHACACTRMCPRRFSLHDSLLPCDPQHCHL